MVFEDTEADPPFAALVAERVDEVVDMYGFTAARQEGVQGAYEDLVKRGEWPPVMDEPQSTEVDGHAIADSVVSACASIGIDLGANAGRLHQLICKSVKG